MLRTMLVAAVVAALWLVGVASALLPIPFGGTYPALFVSGWLWLAIIGGSALAGVLARRRWVAMIAALGAVLLCAALFNWGRVEPRQWFEVHRSFYEAAADHVDRDDTSLYGARLPARYWWLTVDGRAATRTLAEDGTGPQAVFFAQWYGVPDDGGGYFWSPDASPEGMDMAGRSCEDPTDLGDGWWMCGMD